MKVRLVFPLLLLAIQNCCVFAIREILVASYPPVTDCSADDPLNPSLVVGIEVNILRQALANANWTEGTDYYFNCTNWDDIFTVIPDYTRPVFGAINGITISSDRIQSGLKFSQPTLSTGMSLMYKEDPQTIFYIRSFHTTFVILLIILPFVGGFFLFIFQGKRSSIANYIYLTLTIYFKNDDQFRMNIEARFTTLATKILMLIVLILYTAFTTNNLTSDNSFGGITDISSLRGLKVATISYYENTLRSQGSIYQNFPDVWTTEEFLNQTNESPSNYFAYDAPIVSYVAAAQCNLYELLPNFVKYDFGFMMPKQVDPNDEMLLNMGLNEAFMNKTQAEWSSEYFAEILNNTCTSKSNLGSSSITFQDFQGLWYIWVVAFAISVGVMIFQFIIGCIRKRKDDYQFSGLRAEADQKIRSKLSGLLALYTAVSVSSIEKEKAELHKIYKKALSQMELDEKVNFKISTILSKDAEFKSLEHTMSGKIPSLNLSGTLKKKGSVFANVSQRLLRPFSFSSSSHRGSISGRSNKDNDNLDPPSPKSAREIPNLETAMSERNAANKIKVPSKGPTKKDAKISIQREMTEEREPLPLSPRKGGDLIKVQSPSFISELLDSKPKNKLNPRRSLVKDIFGVQDKMDGAFLRKIHAELVKTYKIPNCVIQQEMVEAAFAKMVAADHKRKEIYQENFGFGKDFDFLMQRKNKYEECLDSNPSVHNFFSVESFKNTALSFKLPKKMVMLVPNSQGPTKNVLTHSFANKDSRVLSNTLPRNLESPKESARPLI